MTKDSSSLAGLITSSSLANKETTRFCLRFSVSAIIGVNQKERHVPQTINLIADIIVAHIPIDNGFLFAIKEVLIETINKKSPFLLEHLCYSLCSSLFVCFPYIEHVTLTIEKPEALKLAQCACVTIKAQRKS